jgi:AcrR family transcriptional regulator
MSRPTTKLRILHAAVKLFASQGFENTAVDDIASEANVAKGTIFYNFKTKNDIFLAIVRLGIDDLTKEVHGKINPDRTASENLDVVFDASVEFLQKFGGFCNLLLSELSRFHTRWNADPLKVLDPYLQEIGMILKDGQETGEFRRDIDPKEMGMVLFLAVASSGIGRFMVTGNQELHLISPTKQIVLQGIKNKV